MLASKVVGSLRTAPYYWEFLDIPWDPQSLPLEEEVTVFYCSSSEDSLASQPGKLLSLSIHAKQLPELLRFHSGASNKGHRTSSELVRT